MPSLWSSLELSSCDSVFIDHNMPSRFLTLPPEIHLEILDQVPSPSRTADDEQVPGETRIALILALAGASGQLFDLHLAQLGLDSFQLLLTAAVEEILPLRLMEYILDHFASRSTTVSNHQANTEVGFRWAVLRCVEKGDIVRLRLFLRRAAWQPWNGIVLARAIELGQLGSVLTMLEFADKAQLRAAVQGSETEASILTVLIPVLGWKDSSNVLYQRLPSPLHLTLFGDWMTRLLGRLKIVARTTHRPHEFLACLKSVLDTIMYDPDLMDIQPCPLEKLASERLASEKHAERFSQPAVSDDAWRQLWQLLLNLQCLQRRLSACGGARTIWNSLPLSFLQDILHTVSLTPGAKSWVLETVMECNDTEKVHYLLKTLTCTVGGPRLFAKPALGGLWNPMIKHLFERGTLSPGFELVQNMHPDDSGVHALHREEGCQPLMYALIMLSCLEADRELPAPNKGAIASFVRQVVGALLRAGAETETVFQGDRPARAPLPERIVYHLIPQFQGMVPWHVAIWLGMMDLFPPWSQEWTISGIIDGSYPLPPLFFAAGLWDIPAMLKLCNARDILQIVTGLEAAPGLDLSTVITHSELFIAMARILATLVHEASGDSEMLGWDSCQPPKEACRTLKAMFWIDFLEDSGGILVLIRLFGGGKWRQECTEQPWAKTLLYILASAEQCS
ncbi:hypothetical protein FN846DRAFT_1013105 [Sphaerosporella brunnea]|uniref:Uncharacterized protein n=1 Tax=Sphaerosporella brunnea TaxID=1250544 RepID=A0A5J5EXK4_9PEZI|nr:hypothetical protein FN846DRAFT_1013105 [Sphaerosporella brunnea]